MTPESPAGPGRQPLCVLPGLTTTSGANWRAMLDEIEVLGLDRIALFPTCLDLDQREELYSLLQATPLQSIPHVHLRDDMLPWELDFFRERYHTALFNLHPTPAGLRMLEQMPAYRAMIFLENTGRLNQDFSRGLELCGGLCVDFSHWHDFGVLRNREDYRDFPRLVAQYPVGCCHVSAVIPGGWVNPRDGKTHFNRHFFDDPGELDYIVKYLHWLPPVVSLELENPLEHQCDAARRLQRACEPGATGTTGDA